MLGKFSPHPVDNKFTIAAEAAEDSGVESLDLDQGYSIAKTAIAGGFL